MKKKLITTIFLLLAVCIILYLTFQDAKGTTDLSEAVRGLLEKIGIKTDFHSIRSNAHLVVFFIFGVVLSLFGKTWNWKIWVVLAVGCAFGLLDEGLKILLPTREFDAVDLIKDWIGIVAGVGIVRAIMTGRRKR